MKMDGLREEMSLRRHWRGSCIQGACGRVSNDELQRETSEGEGACSSLSADRSHLPLRGKLGWMTPRAGVRTTLAPKRAFRGPRSQAGAPFFVGSFVPRDRLCSLSFQT